MNGSSGIIGVTPEQAAALPGPQVNLPVLPTPIDTPAPGSPSGQIIEVTDPRDTTPPVAPVSAPAEAAADVGVPQGAPAPEEPQGEPAAQLGAETGRVRTMQGPRGTLAAVPDPIEEVAGLLERVRRMARVRPSYAPEVRPQDFIEIGERRITVRAASQIETEEVARLAGTQTPQTIRMISTRGDYMPTDVQEFVSAVRQANQSLFDAMKRGVQTREQQIAAAQALGLDGAVDALLRRQPGETLNNEGLIAGSLALINARRETDLALAAAQAAAGTEGEAAALVRFGLNHALTAALAGQLNGAAAETGRALGALRFVADAIASVPPSARGQVGPHSLRFADEAGDLIEALGGAEVLRTQAALWAMLPDAAARARFAQRSVGLRVVDALVAAYVNSLLWLPTTHLRNIMGSVTMGLWSVPERFLAGAIGLARTSAGIGSDQRVVMSEALAQLYGMWAGQGEALSAAAQAFRTNIPAGGASRLELPRPNAISAEALQLSGTPGRAIDLLGTVFTAPGRALVTADSYFQTLGSRMELLAQAERQTHAMLGAGIPRAEVERDILAMLANPPQQWRDEIEASARAMVFQQDMTGGLAMLRDVMQHPAAKLFVPFFNTPTNVARAVMNRTPMALMYPSQAWSDIRAGGARADLAMARIALGATMLWWAGTAVMNTASDPDFRITGAAPTNAARREGWQRQGLQAYSICSRADGAWTCQAYSGLDPLSAFLAMATDTANYTQDNPAGGEEWTEGAEELAMGAVFGLYNYLLAQPFLTGVSEIARTMGDPRMDAQERARKLVEMLAQRSADAVLSPLTFGTVGGGLERAVDPGRQSTMPTDPEFAQQGPLLRGFYTSLRRAQARIPGQSADMPPLLNIWGDQVQPNEGGVWPLFWPFRTTTGTADRLEETLMRLGGVISLPDRKFPGTSVELTAQQYNALIREMNAPDDSGRTMRQEMAAEVEALSFDTSSPADQMDILRGIRSRRWKIAQERVLGIDMDLNIRVQRDRSYREQFGVSPRADADHAPTMR